MAKYQAEQFQLIQGALSQLLCMSNKTQPEFPGNVSDLYGTYIASEAGIFPSGKECAIGSTTAVHCGFPEDKLPQTHTSNKRNSRSKNQPYPTAQTRQARVQVNSSAKALSLFEHTGLVSASPITLEGTKDDDAPALILNPRHIRPLQPLSAELRWSYIKTGLLMYIIKRGISYEKEIIGMVIVISVVSVTSISTILLAHNPQYPIPVDYVENGIYFFHPDSLATMSDIYSSDAWFAPAPSGVTIPPVEHVANKQQDILPDIHCEFDSARELIFYKFQITDPQRLDTIITKLYAISSTINLSRWSQFMPQYDTAHRILCIAEKHKRGTLLLDPINDFAILDLVSLL